MRACKLGNAPLCPSKRMNKEPLPHTTLRDCSRGGGEWRGCAQMQGEED